MTYTVEIYLDDTWCPLVKYVDLEKAVKSFTRFVTQNQNRPFRLTYGVMQ